MQICFSAGADFNEFTTLIKLGRDVASDPNSFTRAFSQFCKVFIGAPKSDVDSMMLPDSIRMTTTQVPTITMTHTQDKPSLWNIATVVPGLRSNKPRAIKA